MPATLIFCRTPLQSLIARRIVDARPDEDYTLVYAPTSVSPKHRLYFERLPVADKTFVPFFYRFSDAMSEVATYLRIPGRIRRRAFDRYLVASFNSLAFALLARRGGRIATFDDGSLSYNGEMLKLFLEPHRSLGGIVRGLAGACSAAEVVRQSEIHFTIFPPDEIEFPVERTQRISLLEPNAEENGTCVPISILLGTAPDVLVNSSKLPTPAQIVHWTAMHDRAVEVIAPDVFLPHPHTAGRAQVRPELLDSETMRELAETMIAEELALELAQRGYNVRLFAFSSTALIILRGLVDCINVVIEGFNSDEVTLFDRMRIPSVSVTELHDRLGHAA